MTSLSAQLSQASIVVYLNGDTSSNLISYVVSGSVTASEDALAVGSSGVARVPVGDAWNDDFDENLGDILSSFSTSLNDDLVLSNPLPVVVTLEGIPSTITFWDTIDLDPSNTAGADDIEFDPSTSFSYPSLMAGDSISIPLTSGTFTLETGTYDSIFTEGSYLSSGLDGSGSPVYAVHVGLTPPANAIPEPTSSIVLSLILLGMSLLRRR